ncbi:MAG: insulinase family protein [Tidjanibacter sp.]|nr:insulinase family protein [Tidjanibacter sp.]
MKKILLSIVLFAMTLVGVAAQNPLEPLPADPRLRKGVLENGLTYYIRHNSKPANQGEFYIFDRVGAIQEEDSQVGLAHFCEHMAFNGTKNYPDKGIINYLETIGVKFGANLNAGTGVEQTQYMMSSVPLSRESIVDSVLLVLHDWAYFITMDDNEIDNERGVIVEEMRTRNTAQWRNMEKSFPYLFGDTKYARRNIIGTEENLRNFPYETLRDFYHRWYNTANQCLVIVGDFDVDQMEQKVKAVMADIPAVPDAEPIEFIPIPDNEEPVVGIITDPENTSTSVELYVKRAPMPKQYNNTMVWEMYNILDAYVSTIMGERLNEISLKADAPFLNAYLSNGSITQSCDALFAGAEARENEAARAFEALFTEYERARRFGFTVSEVERAKANILRQNQRKYDNRNDRRSSEFIRSYTGNFQNNTPIYDAQTEWQLDSMLITSTDAATLNQFIQQARMATTNQIVLVTAPEKEGVVNPTADEIKEIMARVSAAELEGYAEEGEQRPLIPEGTKLKGSKVKKTETDRFGNTVWTLKNGVKVVVKQTDFKADEIVGSFNTLGGRSVVADSDVIMARLLPNFVAMQGVGEFSATELQKQLSGKAASVKLSVGGNSNGLSASFSPKDAETMFQLAYLYLTAPRFEADAFNVAKGQYMEAYKNVGTDPDYKFNIELINNLYNNNIRAKLPTYEDIELLSLEQMKRVYSKLYCCPDDLTFTFVGNVDLATFQPLVEKYLGSLPKTKQKFTYVDDGIRYAEGEVEYRFPFAMQMPKTSIGYVLSGEIENNLANELAISTLEQILDMRYTKSIREEKGGTYGVQVQAQLSVLPQENYMLLIFFDTNFEMSDELRNMLMPEIEKIATEGVTAEELSKIKEYYTKQHADNLKRNASWLGWINNFYTYNKDYTTGYQEAVAAQSSDDIKALAAKMIADGNLVKVIMDPAK